MESNLNINVKVLGQASLKEMRDNMKGLKDLQSGLIEPSQKVNDAIKEQGIEIKKAAGTWNDYNNHLKAARMEKRAIAFVAMELVHAFDGLSKSFAALSGASQTNRKVIAETGKTLSEAGAAGASFAFALSTLGVGGVVAGAIGGITAIGTALGALVGKYNEVEEARKRAFGVSEASKKAGYAEDAARILGGLNAAQAADAAAKWWARNNASADMKIAMDDYVRGLRTAESQTLSNAQLRAQYGQFPMPSMGDVTVTGKPYPSFLGLRQRRRLNAGKGDLFGVTGTVGDSQFGPTKVISEWQTATEAGVDAISRNISSQIGGAFANVFGGANSMLGSFVGAFMSALSELAARAAAIWGLNAIVPGLGSLLGGGGALFSTTSTGGGYGTRAVAVAQMSRTGGSGYTQQPMTLRTQISGSDLAFIVERGNRDRIARSL